MWPFWSKGWIHVRPHRLSQRDTFLDFFMYVLSQGFFPLSIFQSGNVRRQSQYHHVSSVWRSLRLLAPQHRLRHCQSLTPVRQPWNRLLCHLHVSVGWDLCVCVCWCVWVSEKERERERENLIKHIYLFKQWVYFFAATVLKKLCENLSFRLQCQCKFPPSPSYS